MIKAVLFDLDNTLIDFMRMKQLSCEAALDAMVSSGLSLSKREAHKLLFELYDMHGIEHQRIFQIFLKKTIGKIDYKILANAVTAYRRVQIGFLEPYSGIRQLLIKLKERGIKIGVVSDAPRMRAWIRLSEMKLTDFFDVVITLGDTGRRKPHASPFRRAILELNIKPEHVIFVGDNIDRDILGAKKLGIKTALAKYGQIIPSKTNTKPDFILKNPLDLLNKLH
jgi:HAD superfamily hydrolase (TIGR02253 family)